MTDDEIIAALVAGRPTKIVTLADRVAQITRTMQELGPGALEVEETAEAERRERRDECLTILGGHDPADARRALSMCTPGERTRIEALVDDGV